MKDQANYINIPVAGGVPFAEPASAYQAYPFNHVMESESGHIKEYDDTEKNERIHDNHRKMELSMRLMVVEIELYQMIVGDGYHVVKVQTIYLLVVTVTSR